MLVELQDFREPKVAKDKKAAEDSKSGVTRVVLRPNPETLWTDLRLLNHKHGDKWTDEDALEVEAQVLVRARRACSTPLPPKPRSARDCTSIVPKA
jgi:transcription factor SPT20